MRILYLAASLSTALMLTACGSGHSGAAVSSSPTLGTAAKEAKARQFVQCARKNGVPNLADPTVESSGDIHLSPPPGLTKESPIVQKVLKICGKYLDGVMTEETEDPSKKYDQALKLSQCVRQHGVPNFPDPEPPGSGGDGGGIRLQRNSGINKDAVDKALRQCGVTPKPKQGQ